MFAFILSFSRYMIDVIKNANHVLTLVGLINLKG